MPRRSILSESERNSLIAVPDTKEGLIQNYTFSESDLSIIHQHRGAANRLGFAIQLCYMRYPGVILASKENPNISLLKFIASQLKEPFSNWEDYGVRAETRREHILELQSVFGFNSFSMQHYRQSLHDLDDLAWHSDQGIVLAWALIKSLRNQHILLPSINVIERLCSEALTRGNRRIYLGLIEPLSDTHKCSLDNLLKLRPDSKVTTMVWLNTSPAAPNAKHMLEHIERLNTLQALELPDGIERKIPQNRLLKIAREGSQMKSHDLAKFETDRRYATLVAVILENKATVIDEIVTLHDRIIGKAFNRAKRNHEQQFQRSGKTINEKLRLFWKVGRALVKAKQANSDPFKAIEEVIGWNAFTQSIEDAQRLSASENFDYLHRIGDSYSQIRRYASAFLKALSLKATPAAQVILDAVEILKSLNAENNRRVPKNASIDFIKKRWKSLVLTEEGVDRRFYELYALSELKNALRSGDIWVRGSRQYKDFEEYLIPQNTFSTLKETKALTLAIAPDCSQYLHDRLKFLEERLKTVDQMAKADELPDAIITDSGLKITPLTNSVPDEADALMKKAYSLLPHVKITELLMEVDEWTGFSRHFTHIKSGEEVKEKPLLLTTILADGINLGLTKMAESCPGMTYAKLSWLQAWHIRDETYSAALSELVHMQLRQPFAENWGDGTTSSSDGQRFRSSGHAERSGNINPKYGSEPGIQIYTHLSDQYSPYHSKVINVGVRDSTYVLDGLLYHESDLRIEEHYTDTAGFTDHVFGMMHLLGFRFAPRIRDLADKRLFVPGKQVDYPTLSVLIGGTINQKQIRDHWDDILRLASSIQQGTVTASLILRKIGSYPRQNGLAVALRELGRIERTLFALDWFQSVELRRRVNAGLNKGEARNALARAVFFNRLGEMRDRSFENQRYRASGLNLITAAIILWNTVYLERAINSLKERRVIIDENLLQHISPLGWEHINLTGNYVWRYSRKIEKNKFRPLRPFQNP
jgi:TnpA family transposase